MLDNSRILSSMHGGQIPNNKSQVKFQIPILLLMPRHDLEFVIWNLEFICYLGFVIWDFSPVVH